MRTFLNFVLLLLLSGMAHLPASADPPQYNSIRLLSVQSLPVIDPSGLDLHSDPNYLWTVSDEPMGQIHRITTGGQIVESLPYLGEDMEGITYDPETDTLWIVEERARLMKQLDRDGNILQTRSLNIGQPNENDGPEGITLNQLNRHFFVANEKNPRIIWELNSNLDIIRTTHINFESPFDITDISGLFHEAVRGELWILSDESRKIVVAGTDLIPRYHFDLNIVKPEGIAVDFEGRRLYVVCDAQNRLYTYRLETLLTPDPHPLATGSYTFDFWSPDEPDYSYPPHMVFLMSAEDDPQLDAVFNSPYVVPPGDYHPDDAQTLGFPYNNTRRTRINGLGAQGISFINTARGRDVGAAVLALDTRGVTAAHVSWLGATILANNRCYAIRLQYRPSVEDDFADFLHLGEIVEYERQQNGHARHFSELPLPEEMMDRSNAELRWVFYYTGEQTGGGARDELRLDNIVVTPVTFSTADPGSERPVRTLLHPNYPNPFNPETNISFTLGQAADIRLEVYDAQGRRIRLLSAGVLSAGTHRYRFRADDLSSGIYYIRLTETGSSPVIHTQSMVLVK
ncbi:Por secretion system C-terminal sorting domain-containing protein [Cyclonatronum proteinivorum]|uniref:Por secretion system C-terminal sorting domain-containing protein n=1 Tax=Cyclonatronum proteinivorum TaxID=1457365 RepID=A0A345UK33_9BACT|nr:SdiA-regulated domain-containing protein [Cyclonatronum proteinivorum]AXJ00835.1 Por secretion system C-terminal sorting domain-containing protein [Cyclonatronum proteinivorum]